LVKKLSGLDRGGALRVLLIREELVRLREQGFSTSDAIYELISRMRKLAGQKRGASLIGDLEEERIVKRRKISEERKSKKRTFDQASTAEDSQDFASGKLD
jgi:predicted CopG family antitoxin